MSKTLASQAPYERYTVYGPYFYAAEGRWYVSFTHVGRSVAAMSYARYLMSVHLGRILTENEEVDHINEDKADDRLSNLQILTPLANSRKSNCRLSELFVCPQCDKNFELVGRPLTNAKTRQRRPDYAGPFCSGRCSSKYTANLR